MNYALDVFYTPIFMKKNRPAYKLSVLCDVGNEKIIEDLIFSHTTSIGIRKIPVERDILDREEISIAYKGDEYFYKVVSHNDNKYVYPEYESAKKLSKLEDIGIKLAFDKLKRIYYENDI